MWDWDSETIRLAQWYCVLVIIPDWTGTWTGILRLFDRFGVMSAQGLIASTVKLIGAAVGVSAQWELAHFVSLSVEVSCSALEFLHATSFDPIRAC